MCLPRHERQRRHTAAAIVGPFFVVLRYPGFGEIAHPVDGFEQVCIQHVLPVGSIEALYKGILVRFSWLDVPEVDLLSLAPLGEGAGGKFRSVARRALGLPCISMSCSRTRITRAVPLIDHVERSEPASAIERIGHEVQCPRFVPRMLALAGEVSAATDVSYGGANSVPAPSTRDVAVCG